MTAEHSEEVATEKLTHAFLFDGQHQPWRTRLKGLEETNAIPSMIILDEAQFLYYVASEHYKGLGAIVEFGPLGGRTTYALASGMAENLTLTARKRRIESYDLWQFCDGWDYLFPGHALRPGDDLKGIFLRNLKAFRSQVNAHKGDLARQRWSGGPIEIMFIDAAKSPRLMTHIVNEFFPHLIPNRSLVIHQDYISAECPWIHIIVQHLREYFEYMDSPAGGSVCMRLKSRIPSGFLREDFFDNIPVGEARRLFADAREVIVGWYQLCVWLAEAKYLASKGLASEALRIVDEVRAHPQFHPAVQIDIDFVTPMLFSKDPILIESKDPILIEQNCDGLNIVLYNGYFYAIPQGEGAFDLDRFERGEYSRSYRANSIEELKAQVCAAPSITFWRVLRSEKARAGLRILAIKPVAKRLVKIPIAWVIGADAFAAIREFCLKGKANRDARGTWLLGRILGIRSAVHEGVRLSRAKWFCRPVELNDLVGTTREKALNGARAADPRRWVKASPITLVESDYRGYSVYGYEYKFFAFKTSKIRKVFERLRRVCIFSYQDFKQGKYDPCLIRHSLSEVRAAVDGLLHAKQTALPLRRLIFVCLPRPQLKPLLDRTYSDKSLTLLVDKPTSDHWPEYEKVVLEHGSLIDWARSQDSNICNGADHRFLAEKFDRIIIPHSFPETWVDNSLEVAASKLSSSVELLHASGERRVYEGENLHRLVYNKAYLASMFKVIPALKGQTVLEAGCSDGLVCDLVALCGAGKVVGIDVMETVGCGFPHERIDYRVMDISRMSFSDQSFDLVYSIATFEHLPEPYETLLELLRVTKIGGYGYVQAGPLYHSQFGHHMFEYFQDYPWIHLRKSRDAIIAYAKERGIDKRIEKNLGMPCEQYVAGMLNVDHVNGLLLDNYKLNEFRKRNDVEILKFNISYEGRELLTPEIAAEIRGVAADKLIEHGFEIAFRRSR